MSDLNEGTLLGVGNPLLDLSCHVDQSLLEKYGLEMNSAILADPEKHGPLFHELEKRSDVEFIPGGATQNSLRVAQWILGKLNATAFFGCVGKDKFGEILKQKAEEAGVNVLYQYNDTEKTGTCAALIHKEHRSLVTDLAAANCFTQEHLKDKKNKQVVQTANYYYISGFFLTVSPESILEIGEHAMHHNKTMIMNLSAPFILQVPLFFERLLSVLPYVDVIFGNESEAEALAQSMKWGTNLPIKEIGQKLYAYEKKNTKRNRLVVFTQGAEATIVVADGVASEYPVTKIAKEQLVDTNGAGDAFVGGFLAQLVQGKSLEECIRCGNWAANIVIQRSGCTLPAEKCSFS